MRRVYVTLFLDVYFIFEMVALVPTNAARSTDDSPSGEIWKSTSQSLMLPVLLSGSADQRVESWLDKQNIHVNSASIHDDKPERIFPNRRTLAKKTSTLNDVYVGGHSGIHKVILQNVRHNDIHQVSIKRRGIKDDYSVQRKHNLLTRKDYDRLSPAAEATIWRRTRSVLEAGFRESSPGEGHRQVVKRDSSLLTEYCGPLGDRCQYVGEGECVNICINGRRKTLCKVRNTLRNIVCVVL